MSEYKIRPHHGLCMQFFVGMGYSGEFTENMSEMIKILRETPAMIKLTVGADVICAACPHNKGGICDSEEKVCGFDVKVLEICGLKDDEVMSAADFFEMTREKIILKNRMNEVCGNCEWQCGGAGAGCPRSHLAGAVNGSF